MPAILAALNGIRLISAGGRLLSLGGMVCGLILPVSQLTAQNAPEPPLPTMQRDRAAREAAAAIQAPRNVQPPPIPMRTPAEPRFEVSPSTDSPIPPQQPAGAVPSPPAAGPVPTVPTTFSSKVSSSTSSSGQFVVHGTELQARSLLSSHCDEVAAALRQLLRDDEAWGLPIVVVLKTPPDINLTAPAVSTSISQIANGGFHLQINLQVRPDLRPADLDAELIRILLAERILRNQKEITTKRSRVLPEWLLTGINQAMTFRDRSRPSAVFAAIFRSGKIYGIEEILSAAPGELDALSRSIYETSCCALVLALLDQPEGPMRFRKFLGSLASDSREDRELLNHCFPNLALSASSLNKWWSLQMAALATPSVFETLGPSETRKELDAALMIRYETTSDQAPSKITVVAEADAPPAEAPPGEEKKRGLFSRMFGGGSGKDKAKIENDEPTVADQPPAAKPEVKETPAAKPEESKPQEVQTMPEPAAPAEEQKRRGLLNRMFGGNDKTKAKSENEDHPPEKKPEVVKADEPPAEKPQPEKTSRRSSRNPESQPEAKPETNQIPDSKSKRSAPAPEAVAKTRPDDKSEPSKPTKTEAPKEPETEPKPDQPKKRGLFGRMFGGGTAESKDKKDESAPSSDDEAKPTKPDRRTEKTPETSTEEKPADDKKAAVSQWNDWSAVIAAAARLSDSLSGGGRLNGILLVEAIRYLSPQFSEPAGGRFAILGFGKKKKAEEAAATAPKKEEKNAEKPKTSAAESTAAKKESKPAARTAEAADAKPAEPAPAESRKSRSSSRSRKKAEPEPAAEPQLAAQPAPAAKPEPAKPQTVSVSVPIEDYANIMKRKDRATILSRNAKALAALLPRANVLFRPIIQDYIAVVIDLQNGKTKNIDERVAALRARTAKAYQQSKAVQDQLDWFEASETKNYSGTFDDYLKLPVQIDKELPARNDPLSQYLDAIEAEIAK